MGNRRQFIAAASDTPSKRMKTTVKHTQSANTAAGAQTSTMPGSHVTPPSPSPLSFFDKIPAEIRVLIYELVYAGEKPLKVKPTVPVRLRKCVLNRLMISKQYFNETVGIFAHFTHFEFSSFKAMEEAVESLPEYMASSIMSTSVHLGRKTAPGHSLEVHERRMRKIGTYLPKLEHLQLHLCKWDLWLEEVDDESINTYFLEHLEIKGVCVLRGLKGIEIAYSPEPSPTTTYYYAEQSTLASPRKKLRRKPVACRFVEYINSQVCLPKDE